MRHKNATRKRQHDAASRSLAAKRIASRTHTPRQVFSAGRTQAQKKADANRRAANKSIRYTTAGHIAPFVLRTGGGEVIASAERVPILRPRPAGRRSPVQRTITTGWAGSPAKRSLPRPRV